MAGINKSRHSTWRCKCDCGNEAIVVSYSLKSGATKSCGCLNHEASSDANTKHGHCSKDTSKTYSIWVGMKYRCNNSSNKRYEDYGGRGIKVCERWQTFENFLEDMGEKPEGMSLDRIDNDGDYCKENCRWATIEEQNNNTRKNIIVEYNGKIQTIPQWAREKGFNCGTLRTRYYNGDRGESLFRPLYKIKGA